MKFEVPLASQTIAALLIAYCFHALPSPAATAALIGWSDEGIHETDGSDVSVYSLFPPFSSFHAQLIVGGKLVTNDTDVVVTYEAVADANGSLNSTSLGKGNFHDYAEALFGAPLPPDQGLAGFAMPGPLNQPQPMTFDPARKCFSAVGVPLTPYDDFGVKNFFPLMRLVASSTTGEVLASTDLALPVTDEKNCRACHSSGSNPAGRPNAGWVWDADPDRDYKLNILRNHDDHYLGAVTFSNSLRQAGYHADGLFATVTRDTRPVLCVRCHVSNALPGTGMTGIEPLTQVMHNKHSYAGDPATGVPLSRLNGSAVCLNCHAGPETHFLRGAHSHLATATGARAMNCQSCHGKMTDVGRVGRQGWLDQPTCQSCHTGTAMQNNGALRYTNVFEPNGQIRRAVNQTFATSANTPAAGVSLYRASHEHGGMACAACHGSAHGEWSSSQANENVQAEQFQGSKGTLMVCTACHTAGSDSVTGGPHGMHDIGQRWTEKHHDLMGDEDSGAALACRTCHGADYRGTALSRSGFDQTLSGRGQRHFWQGFQIGCYNCHLTPLSSTGNTNPPASATDLEMNTVSATPASVQLQAVSNRGRVLSYRLIDRPAHGTATLVGDRATYFPEAGFFGADDFTYSAWDGDNDSNLGRVTVTVDPTDCVMSVATRTPAAALPGQVVPLTATVTVTGCDGVPACDWDFGDGTGHSTGSNAVHVYAIAGDYVWTLTVTANGESQITSGMISISDTLGPPLTLNLTSYDFIMSVSWPWDAIPVSLETSSSPVPGPNSWQPVLEAPYVEFDGSNTNVWLFRLPGQQFFRLRRVP